MLNKGFNHMIPFCLRNKTPDILAVPHSVEGCHMVQYEGVDLLVALSWHTRIYDPFYTTCLLWFYIFLYQAFAVIYR